MGKQCCKYGWQSSLYSWVAVMASGLGCLALKYFTDRRDALFISKYGKILEDEGIEKVQHQKPPPQPMITSAGQESKFGTVIYTWKMRTDDPVEASNDDKPPENTFLYVVTNKSLTDANWEVVIQDEDEESKESQAVEGAFYLDTKRANNLVPILRGKKDIVAYNVDDTNAALEILLLAWNTFKIVEPDGYYPEQPKELGKREKPLFMEVLIQITPDKTENQIPWSRIDKKSASEFWKPATEAVFRDGPKQR